MTSVVRELADSGRIDPPDWLPDGTVFEAVTGSRAYGCADEGSSDEDVVGYCVPPMRMSFPHLDGHIPGFGPPPKTFEAYRRHHIDIPEAGKVVDLTVYGIARFFHLCMENNPNMVDVLFSPRRRVLHSTGLSERVRERRRLFLHRGCLARYRGYALSRLGKLEARGRENPKRRALIDRHGYDTKAAYHIVRLMLQCEQILRTGDLVLDRDADIHRAVRSGEWTVDGVRSWFAEKERELDALAAGSDLPDKPRTEALRLLLLEALEAHHGSLARAVFRPGSEARVVDGILDGVPDRGP